MLDPDSFAHRRQRSRAHGPVIDQEGREIPADVLRHARFKDTPADDGFPFHLFSSATLDRGERLARLEAVARLLDAAFVIPGTKFRYGFDGLIGLIPVVGDVITSAISLWIVREARELGAPWHVTARMMGNIALDGTVGLVPVIGDAFDVMYRANLRNLRLLRRWLDRQQR